MAHPGTALINPVADAGESHYSNDNLQNAIKRHHDIADPVHEVERRHPNEIWIIPGLLRGEELQSAQDSRSHEAEETCIHPALVLSGANEADDRYCEEQAGECWQDHIAEPTGQVHDSVFQGHLPAPHIIC